MDKVNSNVSLFLPIINTLQEKSLDGRISFELDLQNKELYTLQELTRSASLINYIHSHGKSVQLHDKHKSRVNHVFETFLVIDDPLSVFIKNFEQFFAMYIHSKYGKNNFKIFMKECEHSPVAFPVSVFEDSMCIFMQYNTNELRAYIYNIITMFYYYTGQNYYDMIKPTKHKIPRPNIFDVAGDDVNNTTSLGSTAAGTAGGGGGGSNKTKKNSSKTRQEKLCILNKRNYNVKRPYIGRQAQTDNLVTNTVIENCILTTIDDYQEPEVLVNSNVQMPLINRDIFNVDHNDIVPTVGCNKSGNPNDANIFNLSEQLKRECDLNVSTFGEMTADYRRKFVQTNFKTIWSNDNRRQLVTLSIIHSIMNVCIQRITYAALERQNAAKRERNIVNGCNSIVECMDDDEDDDDFDNRRFNDNRKKSQFIKIKKPTLEITFTRELFKRPDTDIGGGCIKFKN